MDTPDVKGSDAQHAAAPRSTKKKRSVLVQFVAGIVIVLVIAVVGLYVYTKGQIQQLSDASFVVATSDTLNIPIARINGNEIAYSDFVTDYTSLKNFYALQGEQAGPVTEDDIATQVLSRLLINTMIEHFANKYDVRIEQTDIDTAKTELLSQFPDEAAAAAEINTTFGWTLDMFTNRVIRPIVLEQKVSEAFATDSAVADTYKAPQVKAHHILFTYESEDQKEQVRREAQAVLDRIKNGEDFATLAQEFGDDGTAEVGGDLGWIDRGVTVPSFEDALFALEKGELAAELVETEFGFHIVRVEDVRTINDFPAYFQQELADADIEIYADVPNPFADTVSQESNV